MSLPAILAPVIDSTLPERVVREQWRYTNTARLKDASFAAAEKGAVVEPLQSQAKLITKNSLIVERDWNFEIQDIWRGGAANNNYDIALAPGRRVTLVERCTHGAQLQTLSLNIDLARGAVFTHVRILSSADGAASFSRTTVNANNAATYRCFAITNGADLARQEMVVNLLGPKAHAELHAAYVLKGNRHNDIATYINHKAPNTTSRQIIKGVAGDKARGVFQGKIHVAQVAQETDAHQLHKGLLLSRTAEIDAKPELEIFADRVKCSHGATIGQLDANALFYLQSRGVPRDEARQLLMQAFVADVFESLESDRLRAALEAKLQEWMP